MKYRLEIDRDNCIHEFNYPVTSQGLLDALHSAAHWRLGFNKITISRTGTGEVVFLREAQPVPSSSK